MQRNRTNALCSDKMKADRTGALTPATRPLAPTPSAQPEGGHPVVSIMPPDPDSKSESPPPDSKERARAAALGQTEWATWGSSDAHHRYVMPGDPRARRRCDCGCNKRASHVGCTNGLAMTSGCEMSMRRWARG